MDKPSDKPAIYSDAPWRGWRTWSFLVPILGLLLIAVSTTLGDLLLERLGLTDSHGDPLTLTGMVLFLIIPFGALLATILAWVLLVERRPLATIGLAQTGPAGRFIGGHLTGLAMVGVTVAACWAAGGFTAGPWAPAFESPTALGAAAVLLAGFAFQSGVEEIVFRGWMLSALSRRFGPALSILLTTVVFTLLHFSPRQPWLASLLPVPFSVFACLWAMRARGIWGVMGWHAGWNWLFATGFGVRVTGLDAHLPALIVRLSPTGPDYLTGGSDGPEGSAPCILLLLVGIALLLWLRRSGRAAVAAGPPPT